MFSEFFKSCKSSDSKKNTLVQGGWKVNLKTRGKGKIMFSSFIIIPGKNWVMSSSY